MHIPSWLDVKRITALLSFMVLISLLSANTRAAELTNTELTDTEQSTDILYLSPLIKEVLDREIRPVKKKVDRALALHKLMFDRYGWNIDYGADQTFTAQETFDKGYGNCVSIAALFVAAARHVDLPAKFQSVEVENSWTPEDEFYVLARHINVSIRVHGQTMNIEFLQTFFDIEVNEIRKETLSDREAFAEYHNNVAMELMAKKDYEASERHLKAAIEHSPNDDAAWSNYGVLDKLNGRHELAEQRYKQALKINKKNLSALTNIYVLYQQQGRFEDAEKISKKVEKYSKKNPYNLAKLADSAYLNNNLKNALKLINQAIKRDDKVATFFKSKAKYQFYLGDKKGTLKSLEKARAVSEESANTSDIAKYNKKIDTLLSML